MNKNVSILKQITKFLLSNLVIFAVPISLIWAISDHNMVLAIDKLLFSYCPKIGIDELFIFSLSLLLLSFIYLAWSSCKLYKYLIAKLSKTLNIVMAIIISAIYVGIFRGSLIVIWLIDSFYYQMPSSRESINYLGDNFIWFGGALFVITLAWKMSKIYRKK